MAGIQTNGLGSGLDINGLVSQLVSAEGAPLQQRIQRHEVAVTTRISALGTLKGALGSFKAALDPLKSITTFQTRAATSGDTDIFTAAAGTNAAGGHYEVEVDHLAQAHQLASGAFAGGSTANVGYGTLTITVGTQSFQVNTDSTHATLADIRDAINNATGNTGVQATLLNGTGGAKLVLTAENTGADSVIQVAASGGDGGLNQLVYDPAPAGTHNLTQVQEARNALIRIANTDIESSTNVFANAIDGVTITAKAGSGGKTVSLDVRFDQSSVRSRIEKFVTEYNSMQTQLAKLGKYDAATKTAGPLLGDSLLRAVETEMRRGLSNPVSGVTSGYTTLASIGITTSTTGTLQIDAAKLTKALDTNPQGVAELFGSENGVAARLYGQLDDRLATEGDIESRNTRLQSELKDISRDKEALTLRLTQIEQRYRKQFTALDSLLSQMQSTSSYLAKQLANLPKSGR